MGMVIRFPHGQARASAAVEALISARRSKVIPFALRRLASATIGNHQPEGIAPRARQLATTDVSVPSSRETSVVPPSSSIIAPADISRPYLTKCEDVKPHDLDGDFRLWIRPTSPMAKSAAEIGKRLDALHAALGLSQADVCRALDLASGRYSQYVSGKRRLSLEVAFRLVEAYGVTLDWLFIGDASALPQHLHRKLARAA